MKVNQSITQFVLIGLGAPSSLLDVSLAAKKVAIRLQQFGTKVKKLTFDNRKEFCVHAKIDEAFGSMSYFARPFSTWARGSKENFYGLLR